MAIVDGVALAVSHGYNPQGSSGDDRVSHYLSKRGRLRLGPPDDHPLYINLDHHAVIIPGATTISAFVVIPDSRGDDRFGIVTFDPIKDATIYKELDAASFRQSVQGKFGDGVGSPVKMPDDIDAVRARERKEQGLRQSGQGGR